MMKRSITVFIFALFALFAFSQTVNIKYKDGRTDRYKLGDIESLYFQGNNNNQGGDDSPQGEQSTPTIVGLWKRIVDYDFSEDESYAYYFHFKSDGTYLKIIESNRVVEKESGEWTLSSGKLTIIDDDEFRIVFRIIELNEKKLILNVMGDITYEKVPESEIDKYFDDNNDYYDIVGEDMDFNKVPGYRATWTLDGTVHNTSSPHMGIYSYSICDKFFGLMLTSTQELDFDVSEMPNQNDDLNDYITRILYTRLSTSDDWHFTCTYVSGSAKIFKVEEKFITVSFKDYKVSYFYNHNKTSHEIMINGKIKFVIIKQNNFSSHWL